LLKLKQITPPAIEPISTSQVLGQLKFDVDEVDPETIEQIERLITAARERCETYQNRAYITQTFELALECFPGGSRIKLPRPLLQDIVHLSSQKNGGVPEIWDASNYVIDDFSEPGYLIKISGASWPSGNLAPNGIKVRYVAGYGSTADDVPEMIKHAILLLTVYWWENGMCEPPCAVYDLLDLERVIPI